MALGFCFNSSFFMGRFFSGFVEIELTKIAYL
jgi:hypothetical protein